MQIGISDMARYPFMRETAAYLRDVGFTLEQFGTDPDLQPVLDRAFSRIVVAAGGGIYKDGGNEQAEIFSFIIAVVMLKLSGMQAMTRKFALAEARRSEKYLAASLTGGIMDHVYGIYGVHLGRSGGEYTISVPEYVRRSATLHEAKWKLVNQRVTKGTVMLSAGQAVRLFRAQTQALIEENIRTAKKPGMIDGFGDYVEQIITLGKKLEPAPMEYTGEMPPCIRHAIGTLEEGKNLPHSGRFMLATYLLKRGRQAADIISMFKGAPDYNPRITGYQLGTLQRGEYNCQSCDKLRTLGLCHATAACNGIRHPLQFGRRRRGNA